MKKTKLLVAILMLLLLIVFPLTINASQINPDTYNTSGPTTTDVREMYKLGGRVAGVIQIVGTIVSAGTMLIIGIRYVISSADEKAEYRERMIPYFVGAVLLFGASNIVGVLYNMFK